MEIRPARRDEHEAAGDVVVAAYRALPDGDQLGSYEEVLRDVADRTAQAEVLVAVDDDGAVLGTATYVPGPGPYAETDDPDEAGIRMLGVAPAAQGRGIGQALVAACVERARDAGRLRIGLVSRPSMVQAHRMYERFGFRRSTDRDFEPVPGVTLLGYVLDLNDR